MGLAGRFNQTDGHRRQGRSRSSPDFDSGVHRYWDHSYVRILVQLEAPACGYATCLVHEDSREDLPKPLPSDPRLDIPDEFVLENEQIRVEFHPQTGVLRSLVVKKRRGRNSSTKAVDGRFRLITEDDAKGMTSWRVGPVYGDRGPD